MEGSMAVRDAFPRRPNGGGRAAVSAVVVVTVTVTVTVTVVAQWPWGGLAGNGRRRRRHSLSMDSDRTETDVEYESDENRFPAIPVPARVIARVINADPFTPGRVIHSKHSRFRPIKTCPVRRVPALQAYPNHQRIQPFHPHPVAVNIIPIHLYSQQQARVDAAHVPPKKIRTYTYSPPHKSIGENCPLQTPSAMSVPVEATAVTAVSAVDAAATSKRGFPCTVCDKLFSLRGDLKRHIRVHTGEKPFPCHICQTYFSRRSTLKSHLRTHTGEKPFVCGTCGKKYSQRFSLTKHTRMHTGEKQVFRCTLCRKEFSQDFALTFHMRIHDSSRPN